MSNKYLFTYCYEAGNGTVGFGSMTLTQSTYSPINQEVLDDAVRIVRETIGLPENLKICPFGFYRFEDETNKEELS